MSAVLRAEVQDFTRDGSSYLLEINRGQGWSVIPNLGSPGSHIETVVGVDDEVTLRVTETDAFGRTLTASQSVNADSPGMDWNIAPTFNGPSQPPKKVPGTVADGWSVGDFPAADVDKLQYQISAVYSPWISGNFYRELPVAVFAVNNSGSVTVTSAAALKKALQNRIYFGGWLEADDGQALASIPVNVFNRPPVGGADSAYGFAKNPITGSVLGNDSDPDGDTLSIDGHTNPMHGSVQLDEQTGDFTYTSTSNWYGTDTFEYALTDGIVKTMVQVSVGVNALGLTQLATKCSHCAIGFQPAEYRHDRSQMPTGRLH